MAEYIERDIFINNELIPLVKQLDLCHPKQKKGVLMAIQKLNEAPSADVVEVVRCKDCVFCKQNSYTKDYVCTRMQNCNVVELNHFCSYGKVKGA